MSGEQMGTLRPIKQHENDVTPVGDAHVAVRYQQIDGEENLIEVLDEALIPYTEGATGFGLFDQAGQLVSQWQLFTAHRGETLRLQAGWGFPVAGYERPEAVAYTEQPQAVGT